MIIDAHAHVGVWPKNGIDIACISDVPTDFAMGNREIHAVCQRHPDRFCGYAFVNPLFEQGSLDEIDRCINDYGFIGCKFHTSYNLIAYHDPRYDPLFDRVRELRVPVLFHTWGGGDDIARAAARHPDITMIAGHTGGYDWDRGCIVGTEHPNVYLDPASSCSERGMIEAAVAAVGAERVIFGTDLTYISPEATLYAVYDAEISETDKKTILCGNAARLFGLEEH
jgi:hypothetical protein